MSIRQLLAGTVLLSGVCLAVANTAFALGDTCSNVDITLTNTTAVQMKVTKFEYYDYTDQKWRTESMFGIDGYQKLEPGESWSKTQDLEHIENDNTKFKVTYEADVDGTQSGDPVSKTTSDFTCKDQMKKTVLLDVAPPPGEAKTCLWTVKGKLKVEHRLSELKTAYGTSALENVEVKVSAQEKVPIIGWGTWNGWPTVRTRSDGAFTVTNTKNCDQRRFKIEVQFQDDDLEVRHEHATSSLDKVKWYTIIDESSGEHAAGTIDYGDQIFRASGAHDLNDDEAWSHADIWFLYKKAIAKAASYGSDYAFTSQVKVKYPHNSAIAGDDVEASYANPSTKIIYIFRSNDGKEDHFNVDTLLHEMGHRWAYDHTSGEICLTETLLLHGNTHGLVDDHCTAFHEGWAEFYANEMERALLGGTKKLPFSRPELNKAGGSVATVLTSKSLMQRHDDGWWSVLHTLSTPDLFKYNFGTPTGTTPTPTVAAISLMGFGCPSPNISFKDVMSVFNAGGSYSSKLSRHETTIDIFLERAAGRLGNLSDADGATLKKLVDPVSTVQPSDELCPSR